MVTIKRILYELARGIHQIVWIVLSTTATTLDELNCIYKYTQS